MTVGGDLTGTSTATKFFTNSGIAGDSFLGNIGSLTVTGDTDIDVGGLLIDINNNGSFGDINLNGGGSNVGIIQVGDNDATPAVIGGGTGGGVLGTATTGAINITGNGDVTVARIDLDDGALGNFTVTGDGATDSDFTLATDGIDASGTGFADVSDITIGGFETITLAGPINTGVDGTAGNLTFTGDTTISDDITAETLGAFLVDGAASFADGVGIISDGNLGSFEVTGDTAFVSAAGVNLTLHNSGTFTFGGVTTITGAGFPAILGDDGTDELDVLGDFNFQDRVIGVATATDIQASALGNVSISGSLNQLERLVTNLSIQAVNNGDTNSGTGEPVALDGSDVGNFSIGNITIATTNTIGIFDTFVFSGNSFFQAIGAIGNVSITAGGSPAVQSGLFLVGSTSSANFMVGSGNSNDTAQAKVDFDGSGTFTADFGDTDITTAIEDDALFTDGIVSIGNVTINASSAPGAVEGLDTVDEVFGLLFLSGVDAPSGDKAYDGSVEVFNTGVADNVQPISTALSGTVGDVLVINSSQQLTSTVAAAAPAVTVEVETTGGIFVTGTDGAFGTIQGTDLDTALDATPENVIIGSDVNTAADANTDDRIGENELIVLFV